jgi:hypothetical protein
MNGRHGRSTSSAEEGRQSFLTPAIGSWREPPSRLAASSEEGPASALGPEHNRTVEQHPPLLIAAFPKRWIPQPIGLFGIESGVAEC